MYGTKGLVWATLVLLIAAPAAAFGLGELTIDTQEMVIERQVYDDAGRLLLEEGYMLNDPLLGYTKHYVHLVPSNDEHHTPGHGGGPGGGGGGGGGGNDCGATQYKVSGWTWTSPYSATASSYASILNSAGNTWDAETSADIFGGISSGSQATAGVQDFINQMDWVSLGASSTIAVTTTWYYRGSGEAVESDAQYNTYYAWSTNGDPNAMDVAHIGTHEIGHTFGLDHPNGPSSQISCLTMYAYASYGDTHGATLGTGDILGIQAVYGA